MLKWTRIGRHQLGTSTHLSGNQDDNSDEIFQLIAHKGELYALTSTGVYFYANQKWQPFPTTFVSNNTKSNLSALQAMTFINGTLYGAAALPSGGVVKYANGSWTQVGSSHLTGDYSDKSQEVTTVFGLNGTLYAGTAVNGVFKYIKGSWEQIDSKDLSGDANDEPSSEIQALASSDGVLFAATDNGVYYWENDSWKVAGGRKYLTGDTYDLSNHVFSLYANGHMLYAPSFGTGIFSLNLQPVPSIPKGLAHNHVNSTSWTETWPSIQGASSYNVYVNGKRISATNKTTYTFKSEQAASKYSVTIVAANQRGTSKQSTADTVTTLAPVQITTKSLNTALQKSDFKQTLTAKGGKGPYTYTLSIGNLPKGITLQSNGTLSGSTDSSGTFPFEVTVKDSAGDTASAKLTLNVAEKATTEALSKVDLSKVITGDASTMQTTQGSSTAHLSIPKGAFSRPVQVLLTSGTLPKTDKTPSGTEVVTSFGVNFGNIKPSKPLTLTIHDVHITKDSKVYKVVGNKLVAVKAVVTEGPAVITFQNDPDFVIVKQAPVPVKGATSPVTGFPAGNWAAGALASLLGGGLLLLWTKRRREER